LNTEGKPVTLAEHRGKKVVLLDFWTYSCINCQRTLPYLTAWYERYRDQGLEVIGIHTPEFSFEKLEANVREALARHGITYPVVLDNQYGTWLAYGNRYWPRKYLIDIDGNIAYDHIGEGAYELTEKQIQHLLAERALRLGEAAVMPEDIATPSNVVTSGVVGSPEVYFGAWRNELLANGAPGKEGVQSLSLPESYILNRLYLGGPWNIEREHAASLGAGKIAFRFRAGRVYMVANAEGAVLLEVFLDGMPLASGYAGADVVVANSRAVLNIDTDRLYHLLTIPEGVGEHTLELIVPGAGLRVFTFTFG
jgi:thiol-disulfide isomerase/thioredoxin